MDQVDLARSLNEQLSRTSYEWANSPLWGEGSERLHRLLSQIIALIGSEEVVYAASEITIRDSALDHSNWVVLMTAQDVLHAKGIGRDPWAVVTMQARSNLSKLEIHSAPIISTTSFELRDTGKTVLTLHYGAESITLPGGQSSSGNHTLSALIPTLVRDLHQAA
jgi:hypothetical protein